MSERNYGSTSVSLDFVLADVTTRAPKTGLDVTTLTLQFHRPGFAPSTATALTLLAAQTTAWTALGAKEVDATNSPGVYRVDCPDAAFLTGADEVTVTVNGASIQPASRLIGLIPVSVPQTGDAHADLFVYSRLQITGVVASVVGPGSFSVTFDNAYDGNVAALTNGKKYFSFTSGLNHIDSSLITGGTLADSTHAALTFTAAFGQVVAIGDTFAILSN